MVAKKSQNFLLGQYLLLDGSRLLMCCKRKVLYSTLVGSNPLTINLASSAKDILMGSKILTPPKALSKYSVC